MNFILLLYQIALYHSIIIVLLKVGQRQTFENGNLFVILNIVRMIEGGGL